MKIEDKVTQQQINALHLYFRQLAKVMNDCGITPQIVLQKAPKMEIEFSDELIKEMIARPIMKTMWPDKSTMRLGREEASQLYEIMNRFTSENFTVSVPFPSED